MLTAGAGRGTGTQKKTEKRTSYPKTVEQLELEQRRSLEESDKASGENKDKKKRKAQKNGKKGSGSETPKPAVLRILRWWIAVVIAILLAFGVAHMFCGAVTVREGSMEPTLSTGDECLVDRLSYKIGSPKRGDIIVFRYKNDASDALHIKRVIGLPGETVQISGGKVLINGEAYTGDAGLADIIDPGIASDPVSLSENEYFVLGDNRNGSEDSRYASVGNVEEMQIYGKLWIRVKPLSRINTL